MFPGFTAAQMFSPAETDEDVTTASTTTLSKPDLLTSVKNGLEVPDSPHPSWRKGGYDPSPRILGHPTTESGPHGAIAEHLAQSLMTLSKSMHYSDPEIAVLGKIAGNIVFLKMKCSIDIEPDGWALVTYNHQVLNLTSRPVARMTREQWFETTSGPLRIEPHPNSNRKVYIQRIHDTPNMSKFACQFSPAIEPGEIATFAFTSRGGRFVHDHYWRQSVPYYTRYFTQIIRHRGVSMLVNCTAIEEQLDGSELSAIEDLVGNVEDGDALITVSREYLQPHQAVTVRWEVSRATTQPN